MNQVRVWQNQKRDWLTVLPPVTDTGPNRAWAESTASLESLEPHEVATVVNLQRVNRQQWLQTVFWSRVGGMGLGGPCRVDLHEG